MERAELEKKRQNLEEQTKMLEKKANELEERAKAFEEEQKKWEELVCKSTSKLGEIVGKGQLTEDEENTANSQLNDVNAALKNLEPVRKRYLKQLEQLHATVNELQEKEKIAKTRGDLLATRLEMFYMKGLPPIKKAFVDVLKHTKRIYKKTQKDKIKFYICYTWPSDLTERENLQRRLADLKSYLEIAGAEVFFDMENMRGDLQSCMKNNLAQSKYALLICTPHLKDRLSENTYTNVKYEFNACMDRTSRDPEFIIPLIFQGNFRQAAPAGIEQILCLDFTKEDFPTFANAMILLRPLGLLPHLFGLSRDADYSTIVKLWQLESKDLLENK